jgi:hypothetical protein
MQPPRDSQPEGEKWKRFQAAGPSVSGERREIDTTEPVPMARRSSGAAKAAVGDSRGVHTGENATVEREESVVPGGASRIQSPGWPRSGDAFEHQVGPEPTQKLLLPLVDRLAGEAQFAGKVVLGAAVPEELADQPQLPLVERLENRFQPFQ